ITSRFELRREGDEVLIADERVSLDPTRPLLGRPTSCVGRDREFAILEATFAECLDGVGPKIVLVTAGAGAGKSRLAHELVRRLRSWATPPKVLQCRGDPLHSSTPYAQIAQAVRQAVGLRERDKPDVVQRTLEAHTKELLPGVDALRVSEFLGEIVGA